MFDNCKILILYLYKMVWEAAKKFFFRISHFPLPPSLVAIGTIFYCFVQLNHKLLLSFRISFSIFRQKDNLNSKDCLPNDNYIIIIILRNYYTNTCSPAPIHATSSTQHRTFPFIYPKLICHRKKMSTCRFLRLQY